MYVKGKLRASSEAEGQIFGEMGLVNGDGEKHTQGCGLDWVGG